MKDIRPTSEAAVAYAWFGRDCLDQARRSGHGGAKDLRDGRLLVICKYTTHHADLIVLQQGDFSMHPRSGPLRAYSVTDDTTIPGVNGGGYVQSGTQFAELAARQPYPLVDDDHGTFIISIDGEELEVEWADAGSENYGNLWWSGTGDDPPVLSWKGPPSVQFGLPTTSDIPGLTQPDHSDVSTPFGCYIYQSGARIHGPQPISDNEMATLVVGACYTPDDAGKTWLVAVCVTAQESKYFLQVWRSKGSGEDWELVADFPSVRASSPAFISSDGRSFVYAGTRYEIDAGVSSVRNGVSIPTAQDGTRTVIGTGGYGSSYAFAEGVGYCWPAMSATGELVYSTFSQDALFESSGSGAPTPTVVNAPVYRGNPATAVTVRMDNSYPAPCVKSGTGKAIVLLAEANGAYCKATWSGVDCYKDLTAMKTVPECNADFSATVTLEPQGVSATFTQHTITSSIVITGPDVLSVGSTYQASNTFNPVVWSIDKGEISTDTGTITSITGATCGTATITATDACGRVATLTVRGPTGRWQTVDGIYYTEPAAALLRGSCGTSSFIDYEYTSPTTRRQRWSCTTVRRAYSGSCNPVIVDHNVNDEELFGAPVLNQPAYCRGSLQGVYVGCILGPTVPTFPNMGACGEGSFYWRDSVTNITYYNGNYYGDVTRYSYIESYEFYYEKFYKYLDEEFVC